MWPICVRSSSAHITIRPADPASRHTGTSPELPYTFIEGATLAPLLAAREQGYTPTRLPLSNVSVELPDGDSAWIWVSQSPATDQQLGCLAQSYVDCVLAGFARHFGEDGVDRFIASTDGWHRPLIADRGSPRYPRAVALDAPERALVDRRVASAQHAAIAAHREVTECE